MYSTLLALHSVLRWMLLALLLYVIVRSLNGFLRSLKYHETHRKHTLLLMILSDLNLLIGLLLYFVFSPVTKSAFSDFGAAMKDSDHRFWAVEHFSAMIIGIILVHAAYRVAKKSLDDRIKFRKTLLLLGAAMLFFLSRIPWEAGRLDLSW